MGQPALDEFPLDGVRYGLKPIVRVQLLVDMVEMVPQSLKRDSQLARNLGGILAYGKHAQNLFFLVGEGRNRSWPADYGWDRD